MNLHELREAQARYEGRIEQVLKERKELYKLRSSFTNYFNIRKIKTMKIEEYVAGVPIPEKGYNFCYGLERQLDKLGRILGSTAFKFGVYYGKTKSDSKVKYRFSMKFGSSYQEAFKNVRDSIVQLLIAGENGDLETIANNKLSPIIKGKILSIYYPDKYLNIFSDEHLDYYLVSFDLDNDDASFNDAVYKRKALVKFKNQDPIMRKWSLDVFSTFLYSEHPRQPSKLKHSESSPLKDYQLPEFAINPVPSFVQLEILPPNPNTKTSALRSNSREYKPDYELESKKLRKLGDRGEKIVMDIETKRLIGEGRMDLAKQVDRVSLKSDALGYDILSFDKDGTKRYIEVKATGSKAGTTNFFYTANELATAQELNGYYIYMVFEVTSKNPKVWVVGNPFNPESENVIRTPVKYRVTINAKD